MAPLNAPLKKLRLRGQPTQNGRARVEHRATLKCDFIAINDDADMKEFSENGYKRAGLQQPIDISDDDEAVAEIVDQFVIQNMYTEAVSRDDDDSVEAALGL